VIVRSQIAKSAFCGKGRENLSDLNFEGKFCENCNNFKNKYLQKQILLKRIIPGNF
jgi:hypothetical protein